ncbi:preprotein translocase subunit SecG [Peptococcus simiae]|uniref:Protein-export membrane protein SecG n=1 Tax=Peptococcus simiae TaxID=1643805 RepID=A0ABW9H0P3_9FIRM
MYLALQVVQLICALGVIATVLLQSGRSAGLSGSISGGAETFLGKRGLDDQLAKASAVFSLLFMVLTFSMTLLK